MTRERVRLVAQLLATIIVLGWVPGNGIKLALMAIIWVVTFKHLVVRELLLLATVNVLLCGMNIAALHNGVFRFEDPDILGQPIYEFVLWGYYPVHVIRMLGGDSPRRRPGLGLALAAGLLLSVPFFICTSDQSLLFASAIAIAIAIALFHEPMDLAYTGYMVLIGALTEYVGVGTHQWIYPSHPWGGVPFWFITMWGGIGLFTRRLALPVFWRQRVVGATGVRSPP